MKSYFLKALLYSIAISVFIIMYTSFRDIINTKRIMSSDKKLQKTLQGRIGNGLESEVQKIKIRKVITSKENVSKHKSVKNVPNKNQSLKYILQWTSDKNVPFVDMGEGQNGFIYRNCPYVNCFVTSDKYLLMGDYTKFDVIAFAGPELAQPLVYNIELPNRRSVHQKYVFASIESSNYYKICSNDYDRVFNWTWTYKLNSDVRWGYIVVRDMQNNTIGPKKNMNWLKLTDMDPVTGGFKEKLKTKKKAAAWFVSNCNTRSKREIFVRDLQMELYKYKHVVDVFGYCGNFVCSKDNKEKCDAKIANTYYFYLSFENAFSEDYVTEKLLLGLNNDAVPIVYGGANYSRFMPDGIYLNARELGVQKLAAKMNELIENHDEYANYFKWKNHYWYHKTSDYVDTNEYCKMCELLNDEEALERTTVYDNLKDWWNPNNLSCYDH